MLLDVTLTNYRPIKEEQCISLEAVTDKSLDENQKIAVDRNFDTLKIAAILGANSTGKSSVLRAVDSIRTLVTAPADEPDPLSVFIGSSFAFDKEYSSSPSTITIRSVFDIDEETGMANIYAYTVTADKNIIHRETLYLEVGRSKRRMFDRIVKPETIGTEAVEYTFFWGKKYEGKKKKLGKRIAPNRTLLQAAALEGSASAVPMFRWFMDSLTVVPSGMSTEGEQIILNAIRRDSSLARKIVDFLWCMDLMDIRDLRITNREGGRLVFIHGARDSRFASLYTSESLAIRRLSLIAMAFLESAKAHKTLLIDDFGLYLHPEIITHLIKVFIKITQTTNGQLCITGVSPTLMDDKLIRRDGIWFSSRGCNDGAVFYSLSDYKYREKHDVQMMYRHGAFGALPILSDLSFDLDFEE